MRVCWILLGLLLNGVLILQSSVAQTNPVLAATPPMGWDSWNTFRDNVSATLLEQTAQAMATNGMKDAGYQYVIVDDAWLLATRDANGNQIPDPNEFPNGIKPVADYIHSLGLKFGIYTDVGTETCEGRAGSYGHETQDTAQFAAWGADYVKADWCFTTGIDPRTEYGVFSNAIQAAGRPMTFSICNWGVSNSWVWGPYTGNLWRTTPDLSDSWTSMISITDSSSIHAAAAGPGHWNDPDMLEVGNGGMSTTEDQSHFSLWAMMAAPLIAGNDVRSMSSPTISILTNQEVIAIDQDPLGTQGVVVQENVSGLQVWARPLQTSGARAVLLLNRNGFTQTISFSWTDIGLGAGAATVRDLWLHANQGSFTNQYSASVPSSGVVMLLVQGNEPPPPTNVTYISDVMPWIYAADTGGPVQRDLSYGGHTISIRGQHYTKGVGCHATAEVRVHLGGGASKFISDIGLDDEVDGKGFVIFEIWADSTLLYRSGTLTGTSAVQTVNLDVAGKQDLRLRALPDPAHDETSADADWAGAQLLPADSTGPLLPYEQTVTSSLPYAFWRLNETNGIVAFDYFANYNGTINPGVTLSVNGPQDPPFVGFGTNNTAMLLTGATNSFLTMPQLNLNTNAVTITGWINPSSIEPASAGVVFCHGGTTAAGINFGPGSNNELRYTWNGARSNISTGLIVPTNQWSYFALVVSPTNATLYVGTNVVLNSFTDSVTETNQAFDAPLLIGSDVGATNRLFIGSIAEIALYKGALTSSQIQIQYITAAGCIGMPAITSSPTNQTVVAGSTATFSVQATGAPPLLYQWQSSVNSGSTWSSLPGATNTSYTTSALAANNSGAQFRAIVSGTCGSPATSSVAVVTVTAASIASSAYAQTVVNDEPFAYWRLNETNGATVAYDSYGVYNGTIGPAVTAGVAGPQGPALQGFETTNTAMELNGGAGSVLTMPTLNLDANTVTITGWMKPSNYQGGWAGVVFCRGGTTVSGVNFGPGTPANELRFTWNNDQFDVSTGLIVPTNQWSFFALVVTPNGATIYMGTNGVLTSYTDTTPLSSSAFDSPLLLGEDPSNGGRYYAGALDEVAIFNQSLSPAQIQQLYSNALVAPPPSNAFLQWQSQYFGCTNCAQAAPTYDFDGTGQNNLFKFVAGLDPTNPASVFTLRAAIVTNQASALNLIYGPVATGRTYTVQCNTSMTGGTYSNLTGYTGPTTNATQATVTDLTVTPSNKFYRVQISLP